MLKWYQKNSPLQTVADLDAAADAGESTENIYIPGNTTPPAVVLREGYSSSNTTYPRTYATYEAQMKLNDDIDNNKSGYLGVETMTLQDFYNAGGYFFVEDYGQQLKELDAAYDRTLPGYGVQGEQMAQGGLTGSGYGDYMAGKAYTARAQGQAAARERYNQSRRSFLAAYNQYRQNMAEQRRQNLLQTVQSAYAAGQSEEMYAHYAKAVGIPQEDIERGMMALRALYNGYKPGEGLTAEEEQQIADSPYGVTDEQMTTVDGLYQQIIGGIDGMTDEDGNTVVAQYPTLDAALAALKGSYKDPEGKILAAARQKVLDTVTTNITSTLSQPNGFVSKTTLDRYADYGIFGEEGENSQEYKSLLGKIQEKNYKQIVQTTEDETLDAYIKTLSAYGYDPEQITEDNAEALMSDLVETLYVNDDIDKNDYNQYFYQKNERYFEGIEGQDDFARWCDSLMEDKDRMGEYFEEILSKMIVYTTTKKKLFRGDTTYLNVRLDNGNEIEYRLDPVGSSKNNKIKESTSGAEIGDVISHNGDIYIFTGEKDTWTKTHLAVTSTYEYAPDKEIILQLIENQNRAKSQTKDTKDEEKKSTWKKDDITSIKGKVDIG